MSSGVLLQLAAYGTQDLILMGNPQISHFRSVYKRHTNFTMQDILQTFEGIPKLGTLNPIKINKTGDMISDMYLDLTVQLTIPAENSQYVSLPPNLGYSLIEYVEFKIGGLTIDKHYFDWFNIYHELVNDNSHDTSYDNLINGKNHHTLVHGVDKEQTSTIQLYIPLYFWFCRYKNCALPIVALQYQDIILNIKFKESKYLVNHAYTTTPFTPKLEIVETDLCGVLCKYIFLDREERKYFASNEAEYLIEQVQSNLNNTVTGSNSKTTTDLTFNHPVKSLFWVIKQDHHMNKGQSNNYLGLVNDNSYEVDIIQLKQHILQYWAHFTGGPNKIYHPIIVNNVINWIDTQETYVPIPTTTTTTFNSNLILDNNLTKLSEIITIFSSEIHSNIKLLSHNNMPTNSIHDNLIINNNWSYKSLLILSKMLSLTKTEIKTTTGTNNLYSELTPITSSTNANIFTKQVMMDHSIYGVSPNVNHNPSSKARITMNGLTRTENHRGDYYNYLQPLNHNCKAPKCGINMYSFSLKPFEFQPSGSCNFSRLDRIVLEVTHDTSLRNGILNIFALNYNVIKFKNGLCSLAYTS